MDIWEIDKLIIFIAFVIPGFIGIKAFNLFSKNPRVTSSEILIDAITFSSFNYAILAAPIWLIEITNIESYSPVTYGVFYFFVLFISPISLAFLWNWIRQWNSLQKFIPHPTHKPWDYVFSKREEYWVKVMLTNGTMIAGKYSTKSFSSSYPSDEQIYLEEEWLLNNDGGFDRVKERTAGIIIVTNEIAYIELIQ
jgi:hypothetical protein